MPFAIIAGTGIYDLPGFVFEPRTVETEYGPALVNFGRKDDFEVVFLARHGLKHTIPPHRINFRANIRALQMLGVERILATFAVGSVSRDIPPASVALVTDFLDFTSGRERTFFDGEKMALAHTSMDEAYCPALSARLLARAAAVELPVHPGAVYVATNGPRFETPAEIYMYGKLGGDVVGMTGVPEVVLAHELGIHYAALAYSINWAAGIEKKLTIVNENIPALKNKMITLMVQTLQDTSPLDCTCTQARI